MRLKVIFSAILLAVVSMVASAQVESPVKWTAELEMTSETEGQVVFVANIGDGWHMYSTDIPEEAQVRPTPTSFDFRQIVGAELDGGIVPSVEPTMVSDKMFGLDLGYWGGTVEFVQKFHLTEGNKGCRIDVVVEAMACNDKNCSRPEKNTI